MTTDVQFIDYEIRAFHQNTFEKSAANVSIRILNVSWAYATKMQIATNCVLFFAVLRVIE